jgi:hypothetical protein
MRAPRIRFQNKFNSQQCSCIVLDPTKCSCRKEKKKKKTGFFPIKRKVQEARRPDLLSNMKI